MEDTTMQIDVIDHWPSGARDTTQFPQVTLEYDVSLREHLDAFCKMDGVGWTDYGTQKSVSGLDASGSRLRTYRKMYEKYGLIYRQNDTIHLSRLGKQMASRKSDFETQKETILNRLRVSAIDILSRYQLQNPVDKDTLPDDCDVLPSVVIWKAMIILDGKLHYQEMNRVILRIMKMQDLDAAIEKIKCARETYGNYTTASSNQLDVSLGLPVHTDQSSARIAPWFSFVGWGGLIIEQTPDSDGFRNLVPESIPIIQEILKHPPVYYAAQDEDDWLKYYIGEASDTQEVNPSVSIFENSVSLSYKDGFPILMPRGKQPWPLNQILFGAPGTGKTYSTAERAISIIDKKAVCELSHTANERKDLMKRYHELINLGQIAFTTFHQSYGYEDFIQGIRPNTAEKNISFVKVDGVFKIISDRALHDPQNNYVIIIDEINRANISKVFGELITLIEPDKRWGEINQLSVTLPLGDPFVVPNNLYIIGTMNSADKSISLIDTALRRRFSFIEMPPRSNLVTDPILKKVMETLNLYLKKEFHNTDLLVGHAYFINGSEIDLADIMNNNIIPLLYEYFYDNEAKVKKALECLHDTNCELDPDPLGRIRVRVKETESDD